MLHAYMFTQSGIPVLYSGDEIGQTNDYSYRQDTERYADSRYVHRGRFRWDLDRLRAVPGSVQARIFAGIRRMEGIRAAHSVFGADARVRTAAPWDDSVLAVVRECGDEKLVALFNLSGCGRVAWINEDGGMYRDLLSGREPEARGVQIPANGCYWLMRVSQ